MQATLMRLLGAVTPKTDAGTKYGVASAAVAAADRTNSRREILVLPGTFSTAIAHRYFNDKLSSLRESKPCHTSQPTSKIHSTVRALGSARRFRCPNRLL